MEWVIALLVLNTGTFILSFFERRRHNLLIAEARTAEAKLVRENRLLAETAESLMLDKVTPEAVGEYAKKHPDVLDYQSLAAAIITNPTTIPLDWWWGILRTRTDWLHTATGTFLEKEGITHEWENLGNGEVSFKDKENNIVDLLTSLKCRRCGLQHRYTRLGYPQMRFWEGYFIGGKPIETKKEPTCIEIKKGGES